ncbi:MAG: PilZ domain-containing protein [Magnetococcales bacterium]|nr:PilZ domain-containing protein [Magnetococcales bacterium]
MVSPFSGVHFQTISASKREECPTPDSNKRRHERFNMQFPVTLVFDDGETVQGFSSDVSLSGFFVTTRANLGAMMNRQGKGTVQLGPDRYTFQCRVIRQTAHGIGLILTRDCAVMGYAISTYIFNEISSLPLH